MVGSVQRPHKFIIFDPKIQSRILQEQDGAVFNHLTVPHLPREWAGRNLTCQVINVDFTIRSLFKQALTFDHILTF